MNKKVQVVIIFTILLLSTLLCFFIYSKKVKNPVAKIYKDGQFIKSIDLSEVEKSYEIKIGDEEHYNILQVSKTGVKVIEATCHDKVCMETGEIHDSLLPIACLPNNLIIKIEGGEENEVDTKTY